MKLYIQVKDRAIMVQGFGLIPTVRFEVAYQEKYGRQPDSTRDFQDVYDVGDEEGDIIADLLWQEHACHVEGRRDDKRMVYTATSWNAGGWVVLDCQEEVI